MSYIVGIDFGTSNSCISFYHKKRDELVLIPNAEGKLVTPSVVSFKADGETIVGEEAKHRLFTNPLNTVSGIKKILGRKYSQINAKDYPFFIEKGENDRLKIRIEDRYFSPQEIAAFIFSELKLYSEDYLKQEINEVVLTIPVKFDMFQTFALKEAAELAGFNVRRIVSESTAASLFLGKNTLHLDESRLFFDLGGGSLDISVVEMGDGVFEVRSTEGDFNLGGRDFDKLISSWLSDHFKASKHFDFSNDPIAQFRLLEVAEQAKIELSTKNQAKIELPFIAVKGQIVDLEATISRDTFLTLCKGLLEKSMNYVESVLKNSGYSKADIDSVSLVGASTRIPFLKEYLNRLFPDKVKDDIELDYVVAKGGAMIGAVLSGDLEEVLLLDTIPHNISIKLDDKFSFVILKKDTTVPVKMSKEIKVRKGTKASTYVTVYHSYNSELDDQIEVGKFEIPFTKWLEFSINVRPLSETLTIIDKEANKIIKEDKITIQPTYSLTELKLLRKDYIHYLKNKKLGFRRLELIKRAEKAIVNSENQLKKYRHLKGDNKFLKITEILETLRAVINNKEIGQIENFVFLLNKEWQQVAQQMYLSKKRGHEDAIIPIRGNLVDIESVVRKCKSLLCKSKLDLAINVLLKELDDGVLRKIDNDLMLLLFRLKNIEKTNYLGLISYADYKVELSQIAYATLNIANEVTENNTSESAA